MSSLRARFESFVKTLDGFEDVDLLLKSQCDPRMRADYLLQSRQFIVEQKTLESNPTGRPQKFAAGIMRERGIVALGTVSTKQIFSWQPDRDDLQRRLMLQISKVIDDDVAKADKQTRDTRLIFEIPDAVGVVVLLNAGADLLRPDIIHYALTNVFQKKLDGKLRYRNNDGVVVISEATVVQVPGPLLGYPINTYTAPGTINADKVVAFSEILMSKWASFNRVPLVRVPVISP